MKHRYIVQNHLICKDLDDILFDKDFFENNCQVYSLVRKTESYCYQRSENNNNIIEYPRLEKLPYFTWQLFQ